jgi:hypothetical protein
MQRAPSAESIKDDVSRFVRVSSLIDSAVGEAQPADQALHRLE